MLIARVQDSGTTPNSFIIIRLPQKYENVTLSFKQDSHTPNKEYAESIVAKYPPGGSVTVYYKPNSPSYSTLDTGLGDGWLWHLSGHHGMNGGGGSGKYFGLILVVDCRIIEIFPV